MIRTLQQRAVALGIDVFMECTVTDLLKDGRRRARISGAFGYWRETGRFIVFEAPAVILATGGIGKSFKVTSNSWEYTGDGHALALRAGATPDQHGVRPVPPDRHGLAAVGEGAAGHRVGARRRRHPARTPRASGSCSTTSRSSSRAETADTEEEADRWYDDKKNNRRPPELLPRDEVARAINSEIKAGRGSPHGGVFLDIASRRTPEFIRKRLPSMYHQFKELADVDITAEPMEIGPTCHYVMGGVEVDADTEESAVTGLYAAGECSGGMHGSNRLGGNSLSDLLVFGRRAGEAAAAYAAGAGRRAAGGRRGRREGGRRRSALAPFEVEGGENPYTIQHDLQQSMNDLVGIIRTGRRARAVARGDRGAQGAGAADGRSRGTGSTTPAGTSRSTCATCCSSRECIAKAALEREESRGGHTRDDFPRADHESGAEEPRPHPRRRAATGVDLHREAAAGDAGRAQEVLRAERPTSRTE